MPIALLHLQLVSIASMQTVTSSNAELETTFAGTLASLEEGILNRDAQFAACCALWRPRQDRMKLSLHIQMLDGFTLDSLAFLVAPRHWTVTDYTQVQHELSLIHI